MGFIRFYLALAVALSHAGFWAPMNASYAVQFFFVISGYYMALILEKSYKDDALRFYLNRALRIFPAYWIVAGSTFILMLATHSTWPMARMARGEFFDPLALFSNIFLFGQDILVMQDAQHALIPPAWSIAMELYFYLLAPFLVRLPNKVLVPLALVLSWKSHHIMLAPAQLSYFIAGIVIYRARFAIEHESWLDTYLGKMAYPLYLVHYPVLHVFGIGGGKGLALSIALSSAVLAIIEPLERLRARIRAARTKAEKKTSSPRTEALTPGSASRTAD